MDKKNLNTNKCWFFYRDFGWVAMVYRVTPCVAISRHRLAMAVFGKKPQKVAKGLASASRGSVPGATVSKEAAPTA